MGGVMLRTAREARPMRATQTSPHPWFRSVAAVLERVDSADFPADLLRVLGELVRVDRALVYVVRRDARPVILHAHDTRRDTAAKRARDLYFSGGYRYDPYYRAFLAGHIGGFCTESEDPGVSRPWKRAVHAAFMSPVSEDACVVAVLVRTRGNHPFEPGELDRMRALESIVTAALRLHWKTWAEARVESETSEESDPLRAEVEAALDVFGDRVLTPREAQVVQLLLRGHSTRAAAERLGIAMATTALHRKRAYAKLGVSSQAELFYTFIRSLTTPARRAAAAADPAPVRPRRQSAWPAAVASGAP